MAKQKQIGSILGALYIVGTSILRLRAGDQIYIIPGCPMPVALKNSTKARITDEAYELFGGVYVPAAMCGELWEGLNEYEI